MSATNDLCASIDCEVFGRRIIDNGPRGMILQGMESTEYKKEGGEHTVLLFVGDQFQLPLCLKLFKMHKIYRVVSYNWPKNCECTRYSNQ